MPTLHRRTFLRGAGTLIALPALEAFGLAAVGQAPRRLVYVYVPNGVHMPAWTPQAEGQLPEALPPTLAPLAPWRRELSVLSGLTHDKARANGDGPGDHARASAAFLTGMQPLKSEGKVQLGISADQLAADELGDVTPFRSLVMGAERGRGSGQCDSGYACAYSNNISWHGPTLPAAKEVDPKRAFDRLFRGGVDAESAAAAAERLERRKSVLDFVRTDTKHLARQLGSEDRQRLDEYCEGLRELERRIEATARRERLDVPDEARPGERDSYEEHLDQLCDILHLALVTDSTRIATLMFGNEGSNRSYRSLGISEGHHSLSHHGADPEKEQKIATINLFHTRVLARLLEKLYETQEGGKRLLDSTMLVYGSGIADGNRHTHHELPVLLCGRGGGSLEPGRHVRWPENTPMNNLHLALLERMGVTAERLGDSTGVLAGI